MSRDWRKLGLAALAAAAVALTGVTGLHAQTAAKTAKAAAKKAPEKAQQKAADDDDEEELKKPAAKVKKQDPAEAQRAIEAAAKLLESGKPEPAVQALTATLTGGNLPPATMAKAFLYRGMAYRQQQKSAQAIADLTSALWLKGGLSAADRTSALEQRKAAYQEAGLTENGEALAAALPQTTASHAKERPAQTSTNWGAATTVNTTSSGSDAEQTQTSQSGSSWNVFGGLFGGGSTKEAAQAKPSPAGESGTFTTTVAAAKPVVSKPAAEPMASSWSSGTEVRGAPAAQNLETAAIVAKPEGRFRVQVAMVRSQDEAEAIAAKVKRDYGPALAARDAEIDQAVVGNMGSFYRVRVGPFATQNEGQAACARLKVGGIDCLVVAP